MGHVAAFNLSLMVVLIIASVAGALLSSIAAIHALCGGLMGYLWIYIGWWKRNHNFHHIVGNSLDFDSDLQHLPLFVVSSKLFNSLTSYYYERKMNFDSVSRFFVNYQHLPFYPVMCFLARINLFAQSILLLISNKKVPDRCQEILGVMVFWVWYPLLVSCLPNWGERFIFVLASFSVTSIQHVQFCLDHFSSIVYVGPPKGNDWFEKQTMGTVDILCSPLMDWFHGGLQFQVEHHLFPRLPRCHLRNISPIVKEHKLMDHYGSKHPKEKPPSESLL
ncbi:acyl-lipid (9-3)-desaturase [Canna indica]|uniref:Acyl-lipid (9-3)-desaturase n=1 Tax=Canna indica TaxID=4628 RepID=A0AAQ3K8A0_9LILI|nr:acyl-lipid (9-3)-desaturase [Canna indica]